MNIHEKYINRCIQLAKNGLGTTYPNPLVGSVLVHEGKIIGEGWHYQAGKPHAEVNAINAVRDKKLLKNVTIYVSLEPCSHFGKTPPCSDLIIESGIKNVVIGTVDPFAKVAGRGIKKLIDAGCNVTVGVLEDECKLLNARFFTFHNKKRPYVILKWAQSEDGFLSPMLSKNDQRPGKPVWITNKISRQLVHKWRSEEQAILIGTRTALMDNPSLTTRDWYGRSPLRLVLDRDLKIPLDSSLFSKETHTSVFTDDKNSGINPQLRDLKYVDFDESLLPSIMDILYQNDVQSLIVEGGAITLNHFINKGLWDEARIFTGCQIFNEGTRAPFITGRLIKKMNILKDNLYIWANKI